MICRRSVALTVTALAVCLSSNSSWAQSRQVPRSGQKAMTPREAEQARYGQPLRDPQPITNLPQASSAPIGTGVKPSPMVHVGDRPNLMPHLRPAATAQTTAQPETTTEVIAPPKQVVVARPITNKPASTPETESSTPVATPVAAPVARPKPTITKIHRVSTPSLQVSVTGPSFLEEGSEGTITFEIKNGGDAKAEGVVLDVAFAGDVQMTKTNKEVEQLESVYRFRLDDLAARDTTTLRVQLVAQGDATIEVATRISQSTRTRFSLETAAEATVSSTTTQDVRVTLESAELVQGSVGGELKHRVVLSNEGREALANLEMQILTSDGLSLTNGQPGQFQIDSIAGGEERIYEFTSTVKSSGSQWVEFRTINGSTVVAASKTTVEADAKQTTKADDIEVSITGPQILKVNQQATYRVEITNATNSDAEELAIQLLLPAGLKVDALDRKAAFDAERNLLIWQIDSVKANGNVVLQLKTTCEQAGPKVLKVQANTAETILDNEQLSVRVTEMRRRSSQPIRW